VCSFEFLIISAEEEVREVLLSHKYTDDLDPTGYWLSEKLDGVRAIWDGVAMMSRNGNKFSVPGWFIECLPRDVSLDGELWLGRKRFDETLSIVSTQVPLESGWLQMKYMVFDIPDQSGAFETRYEYLTREVARINQPHIVLVPQTKCTGRAQLAKAMELITAAGAEGVMLRKPGSLYERKRSHTLLKAKKFLDDEATVIGHQPGEGKHTGKMGALICLTKDKVQFKVGSGFSDKQRDNPPPIGSTITFKYQELTVAKKPRFPTFVAVRNYE
jgi:DNA ligase-1